MTFECFRNKRLSDEVTSSIYSLEDRPMTKKECSAACVMDAGCQGISLKQESADNFIGQELRSNDFKGSVRVYSCSFFLLNRQLLSSAENDLTDELGSTVCKHVYRDSMMPPT